MNLKKLEIYGFKSFIERTEILFNQGTTAIVGPNGCGKSNVADAIRWVLGEQSPKILRASNMQDVIFNGTSTRKPLSYTEVSLHLEKSKDDDDSVLSEVCITRKLYRSGDSEYFINNNSCRLKDVLEFIRGASIGREGYSIIGQGKVESFISSKPDERRFIFDEATGIAGFKQKKQESIRKLERTRDNIERYSDIISEIENQIEPLSKQSENAKKYLSLKDRLKKLEINSLIYKKDRSDDSKNNIKNRLVGVEDELVLKESALKSLNEGASEHLDKVDAIEKNVATLRDIELKLNIHREQMASEAKLRNQKVEFLSGQIDSDQNKLDSLTDEVNSLNEIILSSSDSLAENKLASSSKKALKAQITENLQLVTTQLLGVEEEIESKKNSYIDAITDFSSVKINLGKLENDKTNSLAENYKYASEISILNDEIAGITTSINSANIELAEAKRLESAYKGEISSLEKEIAGLNLEIAKNSSDFEKANKSKVSLETRKGFYSSFIENYGGFSVAVKRLLTDSKNNIMLSTKIEGAVFELIKTPQIYEKAIEAALASALQNVCIRSVNDVVYLINYLKEKKYGNVTFLPMDSMRARELHSGNRSCLEMDNVLGVASELISYDKKYHNIISSLLGATVIVQDIKTAITVSKAYGSAFRVITLDGEMFTTTGSVTGGGNNSASGILGYDRELDNTTSELAKVEAILTKLISAKAELNSSINKANERITNLREDNVANNLLMATLLERNKAFSLKLTQITEQKEQIEYKVSQNNILTLDIENKIKSVVGEESAYYSNQSMQDKVMEELNNKKIALKLNIDKMSAEVAALSLELAKIDADIMHSMQSIEKNQMQEIKLKQEIDALKNSTTQNSAVVKELLSFEDIDETDGEFAELYEIRKNIAELETEKKQLLGASREYDDEKNKLYMAIQKLSLSKNQLENDLSKIDVELDVFIEKIAEEYAVNIDEIYSYKDENFKITAANSEVREIKDEVSSLGNININAIDEFIAVKTRFADMSKQRDDLTKAENDLIKIISGLTNQMSNKFDEGFAKINNYFNDTFKELFGGGKANLVLVANDGLDPLEYGIDIEAEPPGKHLQNLNLLSGGEKTLTAIAIILSIMKLRPMPFCVFDEIEAALDDINTTRFSNYIKRFSSDTQFILITHKKPTMELSDCLYGVTMQEKGISKVVSIKFS